MKTPEATGLLHNIGGPPRVSIVWRGLREPLSRNLRGSIAIAASAGTWLRLQISISQNSRRYRRDWNTAAALYGLLDPDHSLSEEQARDRLVARIEAHSRRVEFLPWTIR
jgi:hypothetical protein